MNKEMIKFTCPMDCFDACGMIATVQNGKVIKVEGDPAHPFTKGYVCEKGKRHLERLYHPERLRKPKKRMGDIWIDISWEEAIDEIGNKLLEIKREYGTTAVLHYSDAGYGGLSKSVDKMFFNYYGGVTVSRGGLCWSAGIQGQKYDFGDNQGHHPKDHLNAKTIIIWGRNPYNTNLHLMEYLAQAKKQGTHIVLIDPIRTKTANIASEHIYIKPSTDGALALGMARVIIEESLVDQRYIDQYVKGYEAFKDYVADFTLERVEKITGIDQETIKRLAITYAANKPSCIIIGYGLQRYINGGNNVRCIDALGAITGNIGIQGGGVNYANKSISRYVKGEVVKSEGFIKNQRTYSKTKLGEFLESVQEPTIKCIFVTKSNPLVQVPNISRTMEAFAKVDFKVVVDMFMTDTAKLADIVLPCTSILEEEDLIYSSMFSPYISYSAKAVAPPDGIIGEYEFFRRLAIKLGLEEYPDIGQGEFLERAIQPLMNTFEITLDQIKHSYFSIPKREIPWEDGKFETPSGKFELYSEMAMAEGTSPLPTYIPALEGGREFPLRLLTPHCKKSLHSQHFVFISEVPVVYLNKKTFVSNHLEMSGLVKIESKQGILIAKPEIDESVGDEILMIYEGWWHKSGSVNFLTEDIISDIGEQAAIYDCFCKISNHK
ncbi:anaerobic selenocysteine-containing dehydrogenase [Anaerosolibacter carboniphilus]|uniref:Anaerobic selenocysteine-containing dehydrogenase n=1 Tax=Anaerosolibacter carboniphilus TaxID=1417629 RepID=A0A841KYT5_9FIRM|nr:molybdopterin-dependent oxidoreductase [Anaerosolibacter carboniphilus]MBB6217130.1 anaerobic selenocysteine-containing dehydrogenase [Anaerosolibacter carboniphilus]